MIWILALVLAVGFAGCKEDTTAENIEEGMEEAAEKVGEAAEKTGEAIQEGAEKAGEKIEDATK